MKHLKLLNSLNIVPVFSQLKRSGVTVFLASCKLHGLAFTWHKLAKLVELSENRIQKQMAIFSPW